MAVDPVAESHYVFSDRFPSRAAVYREIAEASAAARQADGALLDLAHGEHGRARLDLFPGREGSPLLVLFHGGYWRSQDKGSYSFVATAARAMGLSAAVVGYPLAPECPLERVIGSCRGALDWLRGPGRAHLPETSGMVLAGHSAGAHLAAFLAADAGPHAGVLGCLALSGIFDLRPLVTTSIGHSIALDEETAAACSPIDHPSGRGWLIAAVGSAETEGFHQQTRRYAAHWSAGGGTASVIKVQGADHYSILRELADPDGVVLRALRARLAAACEVSS